MGGAIVPSPSQTNWPAMCFNAANHWKLGWYADRAREVDFFEPTLIRLAAFVDYDRTTEGYHDVLIRCANVYMHYNRAKNFNKDTYEYKDHLTIYQTVRDETYLFAALQYPAKTLYERRFGSMTWRAEICDQIEGDQFSPDHLIISIGFGDSLCPQYKMGHVDNSVNETHGGRSRRLKGNAHSIHPY